MPSLPSRFRGFDRTYEELKPAVIVIPSICTTRFDRTYEELKHCVADGSGQMLLCFDRTYEELKLSKLAEVMKRVR